MVFSSFWLPLSVVLFSLDFPGVTERSLSSSRRRIQRSPIRKWVSPLIHHSTVQSRTRISPIRLDREYWSKFRWSSRPCHSLIGSSLWLSVNLPSFPADLLPVSLSLVVNSQYSLATGHLFISVWFCQYRCLHSGYVALWALLSCWWTPSTHLGDVHHFDRISHWLPRDECVHLRLHSRQRLAVDEETHRTDGTGCYSDSCTVLH